jgi:integrase
MDQAASSDQAVLRHFGKCGQDANLDRSVGLCVTGYRSEKAESQRFPLHVATGFIAHPIREDALAASVSGQRVQIRKPRHLQPTESIHYLTGQQWSPLADGISGELTYAYAAVSVSDAQLGTLILPHVNGQAYRPPRTSATAGTQGRRHRRKTDSARQNTGGSQRQDGRPRTGKWNLWLFSSHGKTQLVETTPGKRATAISKSIKGEAFDLRDLRRTCETMLAGMGISKDTRAQLVSHGLSGVQEADYERHGYIDEKRAALVAWEHRLDDIAAGRKPGNVLQMKRKKAS